MHALTAVHCEDRASTGESDWRQAESRAVSLLPGLQDKYSVNGEVMEATKCLGNNLLHLCLWNTFPAVMAHAVCQGPGLVPEGLTPLRNSVLSRWEDNKD